MTNSISRGFFNKFNRGEVGRDAFAREDVTPVDNSCQQMENFLPERLGPMAYRPGTEYLVQAISPNGVMHPFITAVGEEALISLSAPGNTATLKIIEDGAYVDRPGVTSTLSNDLFETSGFWTDADEGTAVSDLNVGSNGLLRLTGTGNDAAKRHQTMTTFQASVPHSLQVWVRKHQIRLKLGEGGVDSVDFFDGILGLGWHEIQVTPSTTAITVTISNSDEIRAEVEACKLVQSTVDIAIDLEAIFNFVQFSPSGGVTLSDLRTWQCSQAGSEMYVTGPNVLPFVIRRWPQAPGSWSVETAKTLYGPYEPINIDLNVTMNTFGTTGAGDITVQSSKDSFVNRFGEQFLGLEDGTNFKLATIGQNFTATGGADDIATDPVFIFGTGNARRFGLSITVNSGSGWTVWLEKSFDTISYQKVAEYTTAQTATPYDDGLDNAEVYYRLRIETANGANLTLEVDYTYGTIEGEGHIWNVAADNQVDVAFYTPISGNLGSQSADWYIGSWGGQRDYPRGNCFYEGRWWLGGNNRIWGSESDFYLSFDRLLEGSSRSIEKTIGFASSEEVLWLAPSARLVIGTSKAELDVRSTTFGEPLTQTNINIKAGSDVGCSPTLPIILDNEIIFVQRGGDKLIGIDFKIDSETHSVDDFTLLHPDILKGGPGGSAQCVSLAFQRNPEPRVWAVLDDGTIAVLLRDKTEDVLGWAKVTAPAGRTFIDVAVLPKENGDEVYVVVKDGSNGWIERFAQPFEAVGASRSKHFDGHLNFTSPGTTITGLTHLNGKTVAVWVDGVDDGDYTVSGNQITGVTSGTDVVVGLRYTADYVSNKLTDYSDSGVINQRKRVINTGLVMRNYVPGSLQIGPSLTDLDPLPSQEDGQTPAYGDYDYFPFPYSGRSETDPRIAMRATGPCKIMAYSYDVKMTAYKTPERS